MKKVNLVDGIIIGIQLILSIILLVITRKLIPVKFLVGIGIVLLLLVGFIAYFLVLKNKAKTFNRGLSILISIVLLFVNITGYKGLDTLNKITTPQEETTEFSIIVLKDQEYQYIEDLNNQDVGICSSTNVKEYDKLLKNINLTTSIQEKDYTNVIDLVNALYEKKVEAIVLNEAFRGTIEEVKETFSEDTRIICKHNILSKIDNMNKKVKVTEEGFNIFISGIDTYGPVSTRSRSDVNMLVSVNPKTKTILLTSIPRDYYVPLATSNQRDKLTHAGLYGVEESIKTLENLMDLRINYYARVNFTSLITMVDVLGGISLYNPVDIQEGAIHYPAGQLNLNGEQALQFSRMRYTLANGDRDRVQNQARVLQSMLEKAMSPAIITNYNSILNGIAGCFETNMSSDEIQSLIQMELDHMTGWHFKTQMIDGTGMMSTTCYSMPGPSLYVMEPNMETVKNARKAIISTLGIYE